MRLSTTFLLFCTFLMSTDLNAQHSDWQPIIDDLVASKKAATVVVGFYDDGATDLLLAGGQADGDSILEIGSISKVFTSLLAQVLADTKKLKWNQTLAESFPDLQFANKDVAKITLRELSTHTSGLPRLPANMTIVDEDDPYAGYDRKLLLEFLATFDPEALDKNYEYSNYATGLLGEIAADAAGMRYAQAMQELVLAPLGMDSSTVGLRDELADCLVKGYSAGTEAANWSGFDAMAGAGAITSSANDMLRFIGANFTGSELAKSLHAIRQKRSNGITALGWHLQGSGSDTIYWHNGGTGGYASFLGLDTRKRKGVVILTASTDYDGVTDLGFQMMTGRVPHQENDDLALLAGVFELSDGFYLTLFERDGRLHGQATGQGAFALNRTSKTEFRFDPASIVITFPEGLEGEAQDIQFAQGNSRMTAKRVADELGTLPLQEIEIDPAILDDYVGTYRLAPGAEFAVEIRNQSLYVKLTGQQFFEVFPFETDKFFYTVVDAKLYFARDASGKVTQVTLDQNNQLQVAPRVSD